MEQRRQLSLQSVDDQSSHWLEVKMHVKYTKDITVNLVKGRLSVEQEIIKCINRTHSDEQPFCIVDLGNIRNNHLLWKRLLPRVEPFYAIKANDVEPAIKLLADIGLSFDCASKEEIRKVMSFGVEPSRIIFANPCKPRSSIKYAQDHDVSLMTFDCEEELHKIKCIFPNAKLVLRINPTHKGKAKFSLSDKFGCPIADVRRILLIAKTQQMNVKGVSFHVGSSSLEPKAFCYAISESRQVFDIALEMGFTMDILDIGGGFPGSDDCQGIPFKNMVNEINAALDRHFPSDSVRIIAEPGRYYVESAFTVVTNIITKKLQHSDESQILHKDPHYLNKDLLRVYYMNDGVYGSFRMAPLDQEAFVPSTFKDKNSKLFDSTLFGPTCDSLDIVFHSYKLPELHQGDWIYFKNMGAYTLCLQSDFNRMPSLKEYYICEQKVWEDIYKTPAVVHQSCLP